MKNWVNVYLDYYDKKQYYVSKSYTTKREAKSNVRKSMISRYVATVNIDKLITK